MTYLNLGLEHLQGHGLQKLEKTTKSLGTAETNREISLLFLILNMIVYIMQN